MLHRDLPDHPLIMVGGKVVGTRIKSIESPRLDLVERMGPPIEIPGLPDNSTVGPGSQQSKVPPTARTAHEGFGQHLNQIGGLIGHHTTTNFPSSYSARAGTAIGPNLEHTKLPNTRQGRPFRIEAVRGKAYTGGSRFQGISRNLANPISLFWKRTIWRYACSFQGYPKPVSQEYMMANNLVQELIEAGVHFGHRSSRWNPKMGPYIYGRKNQIHIVDIRETVRGLLRAKKFLANVASGGSLILFVGTKRQAGPTIEREGLRAGMPFVSERWLGGCLTNFRTIRSRMSRLEELEAIRSGDELHTYSKKMQSSLNREHRKMYRNLNGLRTMNRLPEALVIVDPKKEKNAVREARALGITTVSLIDTDCDPDWVDLPIPGNDDGIRSIDLIVRHLADAVIAGAKQVKVQKEKEGGETAAAETEATKEVAAESTADA